MEWHIKRTDRKDSAAHTVRGLDELALNCPQQVCLDQNSLEVIEWHPALRTLSIRTEGQSNSPVQLERNLKLRRFDKRIDEETTGIETYLEWRTGTGGAAQCGHFLLTPNLPNFAHRAAAKQSGDLIIKAPMAGKVLAVQVEHGAQVSPGQLLLTIEAMKMENQVLAQRAGIIKEIHAGPQQAVQPGEKLLTIAKVTS